MNDPTIHENGINAQLSRAQKELSILYDISNAMRTTLELDHILFIILTGVTAHTGLGFNRASLFLVKNKERILEGKMVIGPESGEEAAKIWKYIEKENHDLEDLIAAQKNAESQPSTLNKEIRQFKIPLTQDGGLLASAYFKGTPIHIRKNEIDKYLNDPLLKVFKTTELVIMPLKAKDKVNGLIIADNLFTQKPITDEDLKIFTMLANQAGLAIENSQLYEMVVHKSQTDSLTGLWNHGFFQDTLSEELTKAKEGQHPLSLLIIDIDDFKNINDSLGHQKGDTIIAELAKILKDLSHDSDYVCRYGGEEFAILLPRLNKEQAFGIAERAREQIAQHLFLKNKIQPSLTLAVSIGVASFPTDTKAKDELVSKADKAMYTAKFIGKNKTCLAE